MNPQMILQILQLLGPLGGFLFRDNRAEDLLRLIQRRTSPEALLRDAKQYYSEFLASPAYSGAQKDILAAANKAASQAAQALSSQGLIGSGVGTLYNAIGSNTAGFQMGALRSDVWNKSLEESIKAAQLALGGAGGLAGLAPRNINADVFSAFLDAFGKFKLPQKQPQTTANSFSQGSMSRSYTGWGPTLGDFSLPTDIFSNIRGR